MPNKNLMTYTAYAIIAAAVLLTAFTPEAKFMHVWYEAAVLAVIMLSVFMSMKDVVIIILISSCVVWGLGFFDIIRQMHQLMIETSIILLCGMALGWYELNYKKEKTEQATIINYKKSEIEGLASKIAVLNKENHHLTEELKNMRKYFTSK
jgi:hypothetical protein